jgi:hypothetical protein
MMMGLVVVVREEGIATVCEACLGGKLDQW